MAHNKRLEKFLALILRHKPEVIDIKLDSAGWVDVYRLITNIKKHSQYTDITMGELQQVVSGSEKKRFEYKTETIDGVRTELMRARQGHSIPIDLNYLPKTPPDVLYHGSEKWDKSKIFKEGLKRMNRHAVHLSADREKAEGFAKQRKRGPVLYEIDAKKMYEEGCVFYCTDNEVWLTDFVAPKYIIYCHDLELK